MASVVLSLFLFGVIFTLANSDVICVSVRVKRCFDSVDPSVFCSSIGELSSCVRDAYSVCRENATDAEDLLTVFEQTCQPGSELNLKTIENGQCLSVAIGAALENCTAEMISTVYDIQRLSMQRVRSYADLIDHRNKYKKYLREFGLTMPSAFECFYEVAEERCGEDAKSVLMAVGDPFMRMFRTIFDNFDNE